MALESIIRGIKQFSILALAAFTFGCSCDNTRVSKIHPCENVKLCDYDEDQFCKKLDGVEYKQDKGFLSACRKTFENCDDTKCIPSFDCDDENSEINPAAAEICNEYDDNCNGMLNEDLYINPKIPCADKQETWDNQDGENCVLGYLECVNGKETCQEAKEWAPESCDGIDNNCNGIIDDLFPDPVEQGCYYEYKADENGDPVRVYGTPGTEFIGECYPGELRCKNGSWGGDDICYKATIDMVEVCNNIDDDCDNLTDEDFLDRDNDTYLHCDEPCDFNITFPCDCDDYNPEINPGAEEIVCDNIDNNCDGIFVELVDNDGDGYFSSHIECGPVDCKDNDPDINPGAKDVCDCVDNNCNNIIDDGFIFPRVDYVLYMDCSISMDDIIAAIETAFSNQNNPACFSDYSTQMATMTSPLRTDPYNPSIRRDQASVNDFKQNFAGDIPATSNCTNWEIQLDSVAMAACLAPRSNNDPIVENFCNLLASRTNTILNRRTPPYQFWRQNTKKYIVIVTDEKSQSSNIALDQSHVQRILLAANITAVIYAKPEHHNLHTSDDNSRPLLERQQGYGLLVRDLSGNITGEIYDLEQSANSGALEDRFGPFLINQRCEP